MDESRVAFQLMIAGNTIAGLTLVFLGNIVNSYHGYNADEQSSVLSEYKTRGWLAFWGFCAALITALSALAKNWFEGAWILHLSVWSLVIAAALVFVAAIITARGIK